MAERGLSALSPRGALHEFHLARGARMETRHGWPAPADYGDPAAEIEAARTAVAVAERCGARVLELLGPGLDALAAAWGVAETPVGGATEVPSAEGRVPSGQERHSALGTRRSALRYCRLTPDQARILVEPGAETPSPETEADVTRTELSSGFTTLLVVGPRSPDLLARLIRVDLDPRVFADRRLALTGAAGIPLQVLRWDRGGLLAWELLVGRDVAEYFAETVEHAGEGLGFRWMGEGQLWAVRTSEARRACTVRRA